MVQGRSSWSGLAPVLWLCPWSGRTQGETTGWTDWADAATSQAPAETRRGSDGLQQTLRVHGLGTPRPRLWLRTWRTSWAEGGGSALLAGLSSGCTQPPRGEVAAVTPGPGEPRAVGWPAVHRTQGRVPGDAGPSVPHPARSPSRAVWGKLLKQGGVGGAPSSQARAWAAGRRPATWGLWQVGPTPGSQGGRPRDTLRPQVCPLLCAALLPLTAGKGGWAPCLGTSRVHREPV